MKNVLLFYKKRVRLLVVKTWFLEIKTKTLGVKDLVFRIENEDFFQNNQKRFFVVLFLLTGVRYKSSAIVVSDSLFFHYFCIQSKKVLTLQI